MQDLPAGRNKHGGTKCDICKRTKVREYSTLGLCSECEHDVNEMMVALLELSGGSTEKEVDIEQLFDVVGRRLSNR